MSDGLKNYRNFRDFTFVETHIYAGNPYSMTVSVRDEKSGTVHKVLVYADDLLNFTKVVESAECRVAETESGRVTTYRSPFAA